MLRLRSWIIYRGPNCLGAYSGSYAAAVQYAYDQWGIGCSIIIDYQ